MLKAVIILQHNSRIIQTLFPYLQLHINNSYRKCVLPEEIVYIYLLPIKYLSSTCDLIQACVLKFQLFANNAHISISGPDISSEFQTLIQQPA